MPFGPTIVELKDADYKTAVINDGEFITVSLVSGGSDFCTMNIACVVLWNH